MQRLPFSFIALLIFLGLFSNCGQNGPRNMRAQEDKITNESTSPLEYYDVTNGSHIALTATANASNTQSADLCAAVGEVSSTIFGTLLKICRPDNTKSDHYALRFTTAPTAEICLFPVYDSRPGGAVWPRTIGDQVCLQGLSNNTYREFDLPRSNNKLAATGVIMLKNAAYPHKVPCSYFANICRNACYTQRDEYPANSGLFYQVTECSPLNINSLQAFIAAQQWWQSNGYQLTYPAIHFLLKFYNTSNTFQYFDFSKLP